MEDKKMLEAVVRVLARKNLTYVGTDGEGTELDVESGCFTRTVWIGFTEFLGKEPKNLRPLHDEIRDEYNRLTAYDMEVKNTEDCVEVKTTWLE